MAIPVPFVGKWPFLFLLWLAAIPILGYLSTIAFPTKQVTELGRSSFQNAEAFSKVKMLPASPRKHTLIHRVCWRAILPWILQVNIIRRFCTAAHAPS